MPTHALTGARLGDDATDAPLGGSYLAEVVNELSPLTTSRFADAGARDVAFAAWVSEGNSMTAGLRCFLTSDGRNWLYDGVHWTWDGAVGELAYASISGTQTPTQSTLGQWAAVDGLAVSFTLPAPRKVRLTWSGVVNATAAGTQVWTRINMLGLTGLQNEKLTTSYVAATDYGVGACTVLRQSLAAGSYSARIDIIRLSGPGGVFVRPELAELIVEDLGPA